MYQQGRNTTTKYIVYGFLGVTLVGGAIIGIIFALINSGKSDTESETTDSGLISVVDNPGNSGNSGSTEPTSGSDSGVNKEEKTIELSESILNLEVGERKELSATVHPVDIDDVFTWSSMDENVATVSNGVVTAVGAGSTNVVLAVNGRSTISSTCTVNVVGDKSPSSGGSTPTNPTVPVNPTDPITKTIYPERVYLNRSDQILLVGNTVTVTATIQPSNATNKTISWSSSNSSVATVSTGGRITGVKSGKATITAKTHNGKTASLTVTVKANSSPVVPVQSVRLSQTTGKVKAGAKLKLTATVSPSNATNKTLSWSSSNTNVAVVDNGTVIGRAVGTA